MKLSDRDKQRLQGVHPDLVAVITKARESSQFVVLEGLRTKERQAQLLAKGASTTMNSRHITGHAVDIAPWMDDGDGVVENGEIRWDWPLYHPMAAAVKKAAADLGVKIVWGGDWKSFKDGPHFELDRKFYP
jgi:peptidoglycan L-alanyl-D-glutamate endopeptidase CwlK